MEYCIIYDLRSIPAGHSLTCGLYVQGLLRRHGDGPGESSDDVFPAARRQRGRGGAGGRSRGRRRGGSGPHRSVDQQWEVKVIAGGLQEHISVLILQNMFTDKHVKTMEREQDLLLPVTAFQFQRCVIYQQFKRRTELDEFRGCDFLHRLL